MTIDTWIGTRRTGDAGDASATETALGTCTVTEPTVANRSRRIGQTAARTRARDENTDSSLETSA